MFNVRVFFIIITLILCSTGCVGEKTEYEIFIDNLTREIKTNKWSCVFDDNLRYWVETVDGRKLTIHYARGAYFTDEIPEYEHSMIIGKAIADKCENEYNKRVGALGEKQQKQRMNNFSNKS